MIHILEHFLINSKKATIRTVLKKSKLALVRGSGSGLLEIDSNKLLVGRKLLSPL